MFDLLGIFAGHLGAMPYIASPNKATIVDRILEPDKSISVVWEGRPTHRNDQPVGET